MKRVLLVLVATLLVGCSDDEPDVPEPEGAWTKAAQMPLPPTMMPQVGWTGTEVLVVGGSDTVVPDDTGGGPGPAVVGGAAYDPESDTWRRIADAPEPIEYYYRSTMVGDVMVVQSVHDDGRTTAWLAYDASDDAWTALPDPPRPSQDMGWLTASDGRVVATTKRGDVMLLDVATATWSTIPGGAELVPGTRGMGCVAAGDGDDIHVSGVDTTFTWDGDAWLATGVEGCWRHWTGTRLVSDFEYFDPVSEEFGPIAGAPDIENDPLPDHITVYAASGPLMALYGYAYDDRTMAWTPHGRPDSPVDGAAGATWADERLVVVGGRDLDAGYDGDAGLSDETWIWAAPN